MLWMTILTAFRVGQGVRIDEYSKYDKNGKVVRTVITKQLEDLLGTKLRVEGTNREWFLYYMDKVFCFVVDLYSHFCHLNCLHVGLF